MSQADLFGNSETLPAPEQARLERVISAAKAGRLTDAHIEAKLGASDTADGLLRDRFDQLADALWCAREVRDAWAVIEKTRRAA